MAESFDIFGQIKTAYENTMPLLVGEAQLFKAYQEFTAPDIDYDILNLQADYRENQAANYELQVEQEANRIREQFVEAVGSFTYGAARRGVKVGEGNVQQNIEESSKALGRDVQTIRENAQFKAGQLRSDASRLRKGAEDIRDINRLSNITTGLRTLAGVGNLLPKDLTLFGAQNKTSKEEARDDVKKAEKLKTIKPLKKRAKKKKVVKKTTKTGPISYYDVGEEQIVNPNIGV